VADFEERDKGNRYVVMLCNFLVFTLISFMLDNSGMAYQLELRRKQLLTMCATWQPSLTGVSEGCSDFWGLSTQELAAAQLDFSNSAVVEIKAAVFDVDFEDVIDAGLVAILDATDEVDGFRGVVDD
jgi:hypothetical protein